MKTADRQGQLVWSASVRFPADIYDELCKIAVSEERSINQIVVRIVRNFLRESANDGKVKRLNLY